MPDWGSVCFVTITIGLTGIANMNNQLSLKEILMLTASDGCSRDEQPPVQPIVMPSRHIECGIRIGADSIDDVVRELRHIASELQRNNGFSGISGGVSSNHWAIIAHRMNLSVDHDEYFRQINEWIAAEESQRSA